jgi:hypothetical protein
MARVGRFQRRIHWMLIWEFCRGRSEKITLCVGPHNPRTRRRALGLMQGGSVPLPGWTVFEPSRALSRWCSGWDFRGSRLSAACGETCGAEIGPERTAAGRSIPLEKKCFSGGLRLRLLPRRHHHHYCENHHHHRRRCCYRENRLHRRHCGNRLHRRRCGNRFRRCYCASRHLRIPARSWRVSAYFRCGC